MATSSAKRLESSVLPGGGQLDKAAASVKRELARDRAIGEQRR